MEAAELTNNWYFDVVMLSRWKVKSSTLPEETIITQPKTEKKIDEDVAKCQHNRLIDRKWRNLIMPMNCYDSLEFINNEEVVLYNCELDWHFYSQYYMSGDTIIIEVILQQFEINDYQDLEPTLLWKLQNKGDQLKMLYMAHKRVDKWVEVPDQVYQNIGELEKIE